jgi:D-alanyl-D-alanine carboxypeptidase
MMGFFRSTSALRHALMLAFLPLGLISCGGSVSKNMQLQQDLQQDLSDYLTARASAEHISTLSMTVNLGHNSPDINVAVGTTKYGGGPTATPEDLFQIGSNTKVFTSIAILQLEAAGILSINDTLGKWLPQYPAWSAVTIRQLLNMTSTIPSYDNSSAFEVAYSSNPMIETTPEDLVAYAYPSSVNPGGAWSYSNTGYILAQMIVKKASPLHSFSASIDQIINSQRLGDTFYQPYFYPAPIQRRVVSGYYVNKDPGLSKLYGMDTSGFSLGWAQGAGGIVGNPADLSQFMRAVFEGNVLPPVQLQELESIVSKTTGKPIAQTTPSDPSGFGLGIFQILQPNFPRAWAYQGSTIGYRATYMYFPSSGLIITIFTNSQTTDEQNQIMAQLFPAVYATIQKAGLIAQ